MVNTYRTADEADADKVQLVELFEALHASPSVLRRDEAGLVGPAWPTRLLYQPSEGLTLF